MPNLPATSLGVFLHYSKQQSRFIWLLLLALYLSVVTFKAVVFTHQEQLRHQLLLQQLAAIQRQRQEAQANLGYYQSKSYQEQALRGSLLLHKPGELVYSLPESSTDVSPIPKTISLLPTTSNYFFQWVRYLTPHN